MSFLLGNSLLAPIAQPFPDPHPLACLSLRASAASGQSCVRACHVTSASLLCPCVTQTCALFIWVQRRVSDVSGLLLAHVFNKAQSCSFLHTPVPFPRHQSCVQPNCRHLYGSHVTHLFPPRGEQAYLDACRGTRGEQGKQRCGRPAQLGCVRL